MKLYGFTKTLSFPCICFGKKCFFFKLMWAKKLKQFKWYSGKTDSDHVFYNFFANNGHTFFGLVIKEEKDIDIFIDNLI